MSNLWDQNQLHFYNFFSDPRIENTVRLIWQQENLPRIYTPKILDHFMTYTGHRWMFVDLLIRHGIMVPGVNMEALRDSMAAYRASIQPSASPLAIQSEIGPRIQFNPSSESTRYVELKHTLESHLTESQWRFMAELLNVPAGTASRFERAYDLFTWMENKILPGENRPCLSRQRLDKLKEVLDSIGATAGVELVEREINRNRPSAPTIPTANDHAPYIQLKLILSQHLVREQWDRMAQLLNIPWGTRNEFHNASDLFRWMELNQCPEDSTPQNPVPYLSPTRLNKLRELLGSHLVRAAGCLAFLENYRLPSPPANNLPVSALPVLAPLRLGNPDPPAAKAPPVIPAPSVPRGPPVIMGPVPAPIPAPAPPRFPANWQQDRIRLVGENEVGGCLVCCEYRADAFTQPCAHLCMCMACARQVLANTVAPCPICRQNVTHVLGVRLAV